MAGNELPSGVLLDLYDLEVTGDPSPQAGTATEVTVSFKFAEPVYSVFLDPPIKWPFTVKVYAEGIGDWAREEVVTRSWTCDQLADPDYKKKVPVTLDREGVYLLSAIVELDKGAGFIMGYSEKEVRISVWTAV